jgi:hypothetical protein
MSNVSVADILKMHGDWIESNKFIELVHEKLKISDRQAYRLIKKDKQILRLTLQDRTVLYGLAEFGLPKIAEKPSTEKHVIVDPLDREHEARMAALREEANLSKKNFNIEKVNETRRKYGLLE